MGEGRARRLRRSVLDAVEALIPAKRRIARRCVEGFIDRPVFVVGAGRSGTTALEAALAQHSRIIGPGGERPMCAEIGLAASAMAGYPGSPDLGYLQRFTRLDWPRLGAELRRLAFEVAWGSNYGFRKFALSRELRRKSTVARHWVVRPGPSERSAAGLVELFERARFVYIHRSGIESVSSRMRYPGMAGLTFEEHCQRWARQEAKHRFLLEAADAIVVRHSDLLENPDAVLRRIWDFIGLPPEPGPTNFARTTLVHPLDGRTRNVTEVSAELDRRSPAWVAWTPPMRETFTQICGGAMAALDYEVSFRSDRR